MKPLIITAAVTGGGPPRARTPHLPCTPHEIADEALAAWRAGAAVLHLHARDQHGNATADPAAHRQLVDRIRSAGCDAVLNFSCGDGGGSFGHEQRLAILSTGCEMASFTSSSYNTGERLYDNRPEYLKAACERAKAHGVVPEIEVLDTGFPDRIRRMVAEGDVVAPLYCLLGFGIRGAMPAEPPLLPVLLKLLPQGCEWGVACSGEHAVFVQLLTTALVQGGHVRTGMEDQPYLSPGRLARSNAELVAQWVSAADTWGRPVASPVQARELLGLPRGGEARP